MIQVIVNSILLGIFYALIASGFSLVWGIMNIINMTHGSLMMLGAYCTFYLWQIGLDPLLTIPISMVVMFGLGYILQKEVINRIIRAPTWIIFVLTFGLDLLIVNLSIFFFTATPRSVVVEYGSSSVNLLGLTFPLVKLMVFVPSIMLIFLLYTFVDNTKLGRAIRSTRMDQEIAEVMGVNIEKIYAITFGLGAALAAAAGSLLSIHSVIAPNMGLSYTALAFVVCVLGGLGNIKAIIPAGIILGFIGNFGVHYLGATFEHAVNYAFLLIILTFIPRGFFGKKYF